MAAPVIENTGTYNGAAATSHTITLPTGIVAGELLIVCMATDGTEALTAPAGWATGLVIAGTATPTMGVFFKTAAGSDADPAITVSSSEQAAAISFRVSGTSGLHFGAAGQLGSTTTSTLGNIQMESADDYLFLAVNANDGDLTISTYPTNYTANNNFEESTGSGGCGIATAVRSLNAASDDPDSFVFTTADTHINAMIVIKPAAAAGGGTSFIQQSGSARFGVQES